MIDPELRMRRAIHMHSLPTARRILRSHPDLLHNPDNSPGGKANTNLHLACLLDDPPIAQLLLDLGHENDNITRNALHETPLHIAAANGHVEIVNMLLCLGEKISGVAKRDDRGRDAVMLAASKGHDTVVQLLLTFAPIPKEPLPYYLAVKTYSTNRPSTASSSSDPHHPMNPARVLLMNQDLEGNTALHYACAFGELMIQRTLLAAGANPESRNNLAWEPISFSATVSAEIYFKNLVQEHERDYVAAKQRARFAEMHAEKERGPIAEQGFGLGMPEITPMPEYTPNPQSSPAPPIPPMSRAREAAMGKIPLTPNMSVGGLRLVQDE